MDEWGCSKGHCTNLFCFALARRKNTSVASAVLNRRWMMGLQRLTSLQGVRQFMQLWHYINQLNLSDAPDTVL
jgi:hypothetical protein